MGVGPVLPNKEKGIRAFEGLRNRAHWRRHLRAEEPQEQEPDEETAASIEAARKEAEGNG